MPSLEELLKALESAAGNVQRSARALTAAATALKRVAADGDLGALSKSRERLTRQLQQTREEVSVAAAAWSMSSDAEEEFLKTGYEPELERLARQRGLSVQRVDGRLLIFPSVVRVSPRERVLRLDSRRVRKLRPSLVVEQLARRQGAGSTHPPEVFLELLRRAYLTLVSPDGDGQTKSLRQIYEMITLLPAARKQYEQSDFVRDLYVLDRSDTRRTRDGRSLRIVRPSTATKDGKGYTFYSPDGEAFGYYAVSFTGETA